LTDYYAILKVSRFASLDEVKRSYRRLAREYHPDVSKLPNAKELFIAINEAYEYLLNKKSFEESIKKSKTDFTEETSQSIIDAWLIAERERMRARAKKYAEMRYNHFRKTEFYRSTDVYSKILGVLSLTLGIVVILGAIFGTIREVNTNPNLLNFNYIGSAFLTLILGCIITVYASNHLIVAFRKK
jgi:curved DNA-binding protein CbpA